MTFTELAEQMQRSLEILEEINNPKPKTKKTIIKVGGLVVMVEVEE